MKKLFLFILIIIFPLTTFSACSNNDSKLYTTIVESSDIALLSLFADNGDEETRVFYKNYGHAFVSITNISLDAFVVGDVEVASNETVTIGTWPIWEHFGVWYNVEGNYICQHNKYSNRYSVTTGISINDLNLISNYINENDNWTLTKNCSKFALGLWNSVATETEIIEKSLFVSPSYLVEQIKCFEEFDLNLDCSTSINVFYHNEF